MSKIHFNNNKKIWKLTIKRQKTQQGGKIT